MTANKIPVFCYITDCTDPYRNLAAENYLLAHTPAGCCTLYLWQNKNTVVIGRNQNPWAECNMRLLREDNVHLVRRLSGGGAVYHDSGNLNFTFLADTATYDLSRQLDVILTALRKLGINAEKSGRNDILADGRKVSGNAFYTAGNKKYHHGTLLFDVKTDLMSRYLTVSKLKLQAKGVNSVKARVINLKELQPQLTLEILKNAVIQAFREIYGQQPVMLDESYFDPQKLSTYEDKFRSDSFRLGEKMPFDWQTDTRFDWGSFNLCLRIDAGMIQHAKIYTDAMDWDTFQEAEQYFTNCSFTPHALADAADKITQPQIAADLKKYLAQLTI